jgi:hypothetical protein
MNYNCEILRLEVHWEGSNNIAQHTATNRNKAQHTVYRSKKQRTI